MPATPMEPNPTQLTQKRTTYHDDEVVPQRFLLQFLKVMLEHLRPRTNHMSKILRYLFAMLNAVCAASKMAYSDDAMEEEEDAGGIAVLAGGREEEDVVVLDEHVGDAGVIVDNGRVGLRIALITRKKKEGNVKLTSKSPLQRSEGAETTASYASERAGSPPCRGAW